MEESGICPAKKKARDYLKQTNKQKTTNKPKQIHLQRMELLSYCKSP